MSEHLPCPRLPEVLALRDGELAPGSAVEAEQHLAGCTACRHEVRSLEALGALIRTGDPAALLTRCAGSLSPSGAAPGTHPTIVRRRAGWATLAAAAAGMVLMVSVRTPSARPPRSAVRVTGLPPAPGPGGTIVQRSPVATSPRTSGSHGQESQPVVTRLPGRPGRRPTGRLSQSPRVDRVPLPAPEVAPNWRESPGAASDALPAGTVQRVVLQLDGTPDPPAPPAAERILIGGDGWADERGSGAVRHWVTTEGER